MPLVIFQLNMRMDKKTRINMKKRMAMEHTMPAEDTGTLFWKTNVNRSQGSGNLKYNK